MTQKNVLVVGFVVKIENGNFDSDLINIKPFRLVKFFSFTSLVVILATSLVLSLLISDYTKEVMLERSEAYTLVLAENVGVTLDMAEQILIGGSFGKYINVEKAIEIGLLPDLPWDRFQFLGNTSVMGSYLALIDHKERVRIAEIAARMTYVELSADNTFYDAFMSALFLPHTDMTLFPSVAKMMAEK